MLSMNNTVSYYIVKLCIPYLVLLNDINGYILLETLTTFFFMLEKGHSFPLDIHHLYTYT